MFQNKYSSKILLLLGLVLTIASCTDVLDEIPENTAITEETDYTRTQDMILPLIGAYGQLYTRGWEGIPLLSVRGDDVNAGGLGDQQDFAATDMYQYNKDYWMYNSLWQVSYSDVFTMQSTIEQINRYKEFAPNPTLADQYIAEAKVLEGFLLLQLSRVWGEILIPETPDPSDLLVTPLSSKEEVMQHISTRMDEAIPLLPSVHPSERTDVTGGVTKSTALAVKALANLEAKNYQAVADATGEIINSGNFALEPEFYELFKLKGKLNRENLLELQYSDFNQPSGDSRNYLMAFFAPQNWTPKVEGARSGWGFYEPSFKFIRFMLDRGETVRLETSVLFTDRGIAELQKDGEYSDLPDFVNNTTRYGDRINDYARAFFSSGKHYLPSEQLTPGRTAYGSNKNMIVIRYAEILLMHAEAILQGASNATMSPDEAINMIRTRANMPPISGATLDDLVNEKFAELAMEWGIRYYDLVRWERYDELDYGGRDFTPDKTYLPYPQNQVDQLPALDK